MRKFIIGLGLLIVSIFLSVILLPWGIIEIFIGLFWKRRFLNSLGILGDILLTVATIIDILGNVILQFPFNRMLITSGGYKFGSRRDTISYVLGHNKVHNRLTKLGKIVCETLDKFDKNHCSKTYLNRLGQSL